MVLMINSSKLLTHIPFFCNNSKPTLWALLHSLPTSFVIKEAFFGDKLRGEGANVWHWNIYAILRCNAIFLCSREMLDIHLSIICSFSLNLCEVFYQIEYDQSIMNYHTSMQELLWISSALLRLLKIISHLDIHSK